MEDKDLSKWQGKILLEPKSEFQTKPVDWKCAGIALPINRLD